MKEKIQKIFDSVLNAKNSFGVSLRVEKGDGRILFNSDGGNLVVNPQYFIASTTKLFTTAMLYKLISENLISLDDNVTTFFDQSVVSGLNVFLGEDYSNKITIRHLLSHTSGIPDYFSGKGKDGKSLEEKLMKGIDEKWDFEKCIMYAKSQKAVFYPGQNGKALYSDTNFQILGRIIEIVREKSIVEIFQVEIFDFLELKNTYCFENLPNQTPVDLSYKDKPLKIPLAMSSFGPDGGIVSTSFDLMIFLKAFFQGQLFPLNYIDMVTSNYNRIFFPLQNGVGVMKFELPRIFTFFKKFPPLIGHSGLSGAFAFYCKEKDVYMTGTVNQIAARSRSYQLLVKILQVIK